MGRVRQRRAHLRRHGGIQHAEGLKQRPRKTPMPQKFRLFAARDVRFGEPPFAAPAPRLHRIPIHAVQVLQIGEKFRGCFHGVPVRETG